MQNIIPSWIYHYQNIINHINTFDNKYVVIRAAICSASANFKIELPI